MNTPDSPTRFPTFHRIKHALFSMRTARVLVFALVCLVTCIALLYAVENYRGGRRWNKYRRAAEARGVVLEYAQLVPQRIPDAENFAATPFVRLLFTFPTNRAEPGAMQAREAAISNRWPLMRNKVDSRIDSKQENERRFFDLVAQQRAFAAYHAGAEDKFDIRDRTPAERAEAGRALLKELEVYEPVLNEFRANISRPKSQYPVNYLVDDPFSILLPHLMYIKLMTKELMFRSLSELAIGDSDAAFNDLLLLLRLADSAGEEPFVISQLVHVACLQFGAQVIWEGLAAHRWSDAQLVKLRGHFTGYNFGADFSRCFDGERAASITTIDNIRRRGNAGDVLGIVLTPDSGPVVPIDQRTFANLASRLAPRGWYEMEMFNYCRYFDQQRLSDPTTQFDLASLRKRNAELETELKIGPVETILRHRFFAKLMFPAIARITIKVNLGQTLANQVATACALEQYRLANGEFPESLERLVPQYLKTAPRDLFGNGPLKYRRTAKDTFVLYSIGGNEKDDGGKPGKTLFDESSGDWLWTCP
jgi:hypothetical protein